MLHPRDILIILDALSDKYGPGYSDDEAVGRLQAKLSIMLEAKTKTEGQLRRNAAAARQSWPA